MRALLAIVALAFVGCASTPAPDYYAEAREREAIAAKQRAAELAQREEAAWQAAEADICRAAIVSTACDGVEAYARDFELGAHHAEALALLREKAPELARLREEEAWTGAEWIRCSAAREQGDCAGVAQYLIDHPQGAHHVRAQELLDQARERQAERQHQDAAREQALGTQRSAPITDHMFAPSSTTIPSPGTTADGSVPSSSPPYVPGRTQHVRGYTRKDGTVVQPYYRRPAH